MEITLTFSEALHSCNDWDEFCDDLGLNPWCLNEGLASDDDTITITKEQAVNHGIID